MKSRIKKVTATIMLACFVFFGGNPSTAFANNWFTKFTSSTIKTNESAWSDQQRGYYSGGGYSTRTNVDRSTLFNISPPRLSGGCGGIDAFWGGFSFLNPEYLIQKLKNILQAAPAYAFELALRQLCQTCASIMDTLQAISDMLNQLALDDCQATRALVNAGASGIGFMMEKTGVQTAWGTMDGQGASWVKEQQKWITDGLADFTKNYNEILNFRYGCDQGSNSEQDACKKKYTLSGSMWSMAMKRNEERYPNYKLGAEFEKLGRAIYGDIYFVKPDESKKEGKGGRAETMTPCDKAVSVILEALTSVPSKENEQQGYIDQIDVIIQNENGSCSRVGFTNVLSKSEIEPLLFGLKASEVLIKIKKEMKTPNGKLENDEIAFINQSVIPVYALLNTLALLPGQAQSTSTGLSSLEFKTAKLMAVSHAIYVLESLNNDAMYMLQYMIDNIAELDLGIYGMTVERLNGYRQQFLHTHDQVAKIMYGEFQSAQSQYGQEINAISQMYNVRRIYQQLLVQSMR